MPAAAGATLVALGLTATLTSLPSAEEDHKTSMAAHTGTPLEPERDIPTTTTTTTTKKKPKHRKKAQRVVTATIKKPTKPPVEECSTELDGTLPPVAQVGHHVMEKFDVDDVGGRASRGGTSDHPSGLAIDFMVDPETGDALADYVLQNQSDFGVTYVIWQQQYNDGSGWSPMEDRGSPTANHMDHVHVSFSGEQVDVTC